MNRSRVQAILIFSALFVVDCDCSPGDINVDPNCPDGKPASASLSVVGDLVAIRPIGSDKQIRVRGTRGASESVCFADGGELTFKVVLEGQEPGTTLNVPPLAHGAWEFSVIPLSGGDHPEIAPIAKTLSPGGSFQITVGANDSGDIQASVTP